MIFLIIMGLLIAGIIGFLPAITKIIFGVVLAVIVVYVVKLILGRFAR